MRFYHILQLKYIFGNRLKIGHRSKIFFPININHKMHSVTIGDDVTINKYVDIRGKGSIVISNNTILSKHCTIITVSHDYDSDTLPCSRIQTPYKIIIESGVWIGVHAIIVGKKNMIIREGSVIGAGAVVTKSTERLSINGGNPSVKIGERSEKFYNTAKWGWEHDEYE